jgi:uncharacterized protein (TIGR02300 family)
MVKPELGKKHVCVSCGTRFYDLMKSPAVCPKCGTEQPAEQPRLRRAAAITEDRRLKRAEPAPGAEELELDIVPDEEEGVEEVLEDASELEDAAPLTEDIEMETEPDEGEH